MQLNSDKVNIILDTTSDFPTVRECGVVIVTPSKYHVGSWEVVVSDVVGYGRGKDGWTIGWVLYAQCPTKERAIQLANEDFIEAAA